MLYHVCFSVAVDEPYPPLASMATVEAYSPLEAVKAAVEARRQVPQDRIYRWARVVIESQDGKPTNALRFPIKQDVFVPLDD